MAKSKKTELHKQSFLERLDRFLQNHETLFFWLIFAITAVFGLALYDPRVSLTGDDSAYILGANNFVNSFIFPGFQGPLYPLTLSILVSLFGISLFPLKLFSLLSMLAFMYMTFITFRKKIPAGLLFSVLLLTSVNSYVLYYASQTYSEAFYMFMQSLVLFVFFRFFTGSDEKQLRLISLLKRHAWLALALLGASLTRSVGFALIIAVSGYFIFRKQWKNLGLSVISVIAIFFIYNGLKMLIWPENGFQLSSQGSGLMYKNYYQPDLGKEDFSGFITRFLENSNQYLSNGLSGIMGFRKEPGNNSAFLTILIYAAAISGLFYSYRKNKPVFFSGIMTGVFLIVTFVSLQVSWNQERLLIPQYTFILLILLATLYYFLSGEKRRAFQFIFLIPVIILLFSGLKDTTEAITKVRKVKSVYDGLSPDWVHYLKASEWIGNQFGETDDFAACRKPEISTIYAHGKRFYGIYSLPTWDKDQFMKKWETHPDSYLAVPVTGDNFNYSYYQSAGKDHVGRIEMGQNAFLLANSTERLRNSLSENKISYLGVTDFGQLAKASGNVYSLYYSDSLLLKLKDAGVTHILTAQLRINPEIKSGYTISTVERYAYYMQEKYGDLLFEPVHQEGANEDEPARILRIRWELLDQ